MTASNHIAVVGGGLAGLTAAATIARGGGHPVVFEGAKRPGGRAQTTASGDYRFNLGPHALYRGAQRVLADLGVEVRGANPRVAGLAYRDGKLHRLPLSAWTLATTGLLDPMDRAEFARVLASIGHIDLDEWHDRTVDEWLDSAAKRPRVRQALRALLRLAAYTDAPSQLSAAAALAQVGGGAGVLYVDGGWSTIVDSLRLLVEGSGGEVRTATRIDAVRLVLGGVEVAAPGYREQFAGAILTGSPSSVVSLLGAAAPAALASAAERAIPVQAAVLDVGVRRLPRPRRKFAIGIDRPYYLSVHSAVAEGLAPPGGATLNAARYTPAGESRRHPGDVERELEGWLDAVQPGWREVVETRRFMPNLTVMNTLPRADAGGLPGRPAIDAAGIPGIYIAGDWVGKRALLSDAATGSGATAGAAALAFAANPRQTAVA